MLHLLLAEAVRLGDKEMIEALGPTGASAGGSNRDLEEEAAVPPALIGLVAQRGQTGLLERLLKLSKLTEKKPAVKPAILATTKKTDKEKTAVLQQCLNALLEAALAAGVRCYARAKHLRPACKLRSGAATTIAYVRPCWCRAVPLHRCVPAPAAAAALCPDCAISGAASEILPHAALYLS